MYNCTRFGYKNTNRAMKPATVIKDSENIKLDLRYALEKRILDVWSELDRATPIQLENRIKLKGLGHSIAKLSLIKLYQITSYRNVWNILLFENQRTGKSVNEIINELVGYYRSDSIQHSDIAEMKEIQDTIIKLLREMLIC